MHVKTILNCVYHQPGFVYSEFRLTEGSAASQPILHVTMKPRAGSRATCSRCKERAPGYDTLEERRFEFIPLWGIVVFLYYAMRRVDCPVPPRVVRPGSSRDPIPGWPQAQRGRPRSGTGAAVGVCRPA
jgi:hypothetical protein